MQEIPQFPSSEKISDWPRAKLLADDDKRFLGEQLRKHKLSDDEYHRMLKIVERQPTMAELGIFSSMWSEHCSYKSSKVHLKRLPTKGPHVVVGPGENAGVVRLEDKLCIAFKMESHNHPSYIEPYQGAATGVGGILRDVFCMGARPVANLNCLRFGAPTHHRTNYLYSNVVRGIGDYGNCIGVPTVGGNLSFDPTYDGNILVNAMTAGVIHEDRIFKGYASGPGNLVVYLGSATGRDGIHGATMASDSFASAQSEERSTVQVGDPFTEKLLLEATLAALENDLVVGLQDMGAAGLTSSSFEMASRAGSGLYIDLDRVPVRAKNMTAYELLLSESQERMLMVVEPEKWPKLKELLGRWELSYDVIGCVTTTQRMQITYQGVLEVDLPIAPLADDAPVYERPLADRRPVQSEADARLIFLETLQKQGFEHAVEQSLAMTGSKEFVYRQYDHHIGTKTVLSSEHGGAAVLWLRSEWAPAKPHIGLALATACNERYCAADPKLGAAHAVVKSARMIAAAGGIPLAVTDCLNYGNPEVPEVMSEISNGVDGIGEACVELSTPVVSGNVSLYNETDGQSIAPTPMIGMVGKVEDCRHARSAVLPASDQVWPLYLLLPNHAEFVVGPSRMARTLGMNLQVGSPPSIIWDAEREAIDFLTSHAVSKVLQVARDVADGGIGLTIAKMCLVNGFGFTIDDQANQQLTDMAKDRFIGLFGELSGAYVVSGHDSDKIEGLAAQLQYSRLIRLGDASPSMDCFDWGLFSQDKKRLRSIWEASVQV